MVAIYLPVHMFMEDGSSGLVGFPHITFIGCMQMRIPICRKSEHLFLILPSEHLLPIFTGAASQKQQPSNYFFRLILTNHVKKKFV